MRHTKSILQSVLFLQKNLRANVEQSMIYDWSLFTKTVLNGFK
jgi:hypothetical protein